MSRTRTITLTVGSLAVGALLATGATGLAMADDTGASTTSSAASAALGATSDGPGAHAGMRGGPDSSMRGPGAGHKGMRGGPIGQPLHGEAVVKAEDGTILTVRQVHGTVTAVSADSITVEAEDGYSGTFAVSADTAVRTGIPQRDGSEPGTDSLADVSVGDVAHVGGTVVDGVATADRIHAMTPEEAATMEQQRQQHREDRAAQDSDAATQSS